ncbi:hypothetical protein GGR56DRAFT_606190 [Xylariaceae sp. FL0804]|nr:hypothetical protein GGR56DRAFT_606190 [Xylariaceae sp. FL0804]
MEVPDSKRPRGPGCRPSFRLRGLAGWREDDGDDTPIPSPSARAGEDAAGRQADTRASRRRRSTEMMPVRSMPTQLDRLPSIRRMRDGEPQHPGAPPSPFPQTWPANPSCVGMGEGYQSVQHGSRHTHVPGPMTDGPAEADQRGPTRHHRAGRCRSCSSGLARLDSTQLTRGSQYRAGTDEVTVTLRDERDPDMPASQPATSFRQP